MQTCGNSFLLSLFLVSSYFSFFSFQPHLNKQGNERNTSHRERAREIYLTVIYLSIHLSTYLSIHHHHVQQGATTRIYRSSNLQLSPRALRTPRPSSHSRGMDSTCCRYVVSFIQMFNNFLVELFVLPPTKNIRSLFFFLKKIKPRLKIIS